MLTCGSARPIQVTQSSTSRYETESRVQMFEPTMLIRLRKLLARRPSMIQRLVDALGNPSPRIAQQAFDLALELGPTCGEALAIQLPAMLAAAELEPPQNAQALRRIDAPLCATIALIERLAPEYIPALCSATASRRITSSTPPWWTFRARQHLQDAQRRQRSAMM